MTLQAIVFYALAGVILTATGLAITRRNLVHAVVYLILSFFGSALLFYLCGAPFLAALEVIIYAGAIMVLFLFIVMMLKPASAAEPLWHLRQWLPAAAMGLLYLGLVIAMVFSDPGNREMLVSAVADPRAFGRYLFTGHWLAIEIVSLLLLVALVGVLILGRGGRPQSAEPEEIP